MIRLKNILLEYEDSHEEMMNVLFVVDDADLKKFGFIRHIISQRVIVGEIESADKQNSESLKDIVLTQANPELDLIVIVSRGIYDDDPVDVIRNFDIIQQYADTIDVPVVYFSLSTLRFIEDKKDISDNWTEIERKKINNILRRKFNHVIDLSDFELDEYFRKNGLDYNLNAHLILYKRLFRKIREFDPRAQVQTDLKSVPCNITKLHKKLILLGYEIDLLEVAKKIYGATTKSAVDELSSKLGYRPSEELTTSICNAILLLTPESNVVQDVEIVNAHCPDPVYPGAKKKFATPANYKGKNGNRKLVALKISKYNVELDLDAADQFDLMIDDMKDDDISYEGTLYGFRSYKRQYEMFNWETYECTGQRKSIEGNRQALPGESNHGLGLAVDVSGKDAQDWIKENGEDYGWTWDEGKAAGEDWHFRFDPSKVKKSLLSKLASLVS
jgi:hypothetical protein